MQINDWRNTGNMIEYINAAYEIEENTRGLKATRLAWTALSWWNKHYYMLIYHFEEY